MDTQETSGSAQAQRERQFYEEKAAGTTNGVAMLTLSLLALLAGIILLCVGINLSYDGFATTPGADLIIFSGLVLIVIVSPVLLSGLKLVRPNEAMVLMLFGKYVGTIKKEGLYFVNPLARPMRFLNDTRISLKATTLNSDEQKINDLLGNPVIIKTMVIWRVVNTAKAAFNVANYRDYLSLQCDSAVRNIARLYPYDVARDDNHEKTLRGSSQEIAEKIKAEIQEKTELAGLEILDAKIIQLSYSPEIAAAMLQRQQAAAIIDARTLLVEGAVSMVEMALQKLNDKDIVQLDEERKAAMVSNLLVILCGSKEAHPVVNAGTLY